MRYRESLICIVHWVEEVNELIIWKAIYIWGYECLSYNYD